MQQSTLKTDPYRLLFPMGFILNLWGVLIWIPFLLQWTAIYPGDNHSTFMIGGFILSFAAGFLMTAMPKFTRTAPASLHETLSVLVPLAGMPIASLARTQGGLYLFSLIGLSFLARFALLRFKKRTTTLPESYLFIGVGLASAAFGLILLLLINLAIITPNFNPLAKLFYLQAFPLSLIVGVGSKLLPAIMGWGPPAFFKLKTKYFFIIFSFLFIFSFALESAIVPSYGRLLRALLISIIAIYTWKIFKFPQTKTNLTWGLWLSTWLLTLGQWSAAIFQNYYIHFLHLTFIGGIGLMTLLIATRVILAHGGFNLAQENKSKSLLLILALALSTALTRLSAGLITSAYLSHLLYAALLWIILLLIWGWHFARKIQIFSILQKISKESL